MRVVRAVSGTEMPIYAYKCPACGSELEAFRAMHLADKPFPCQKCPEKAIRVLSPASIPPSRVQR